MAIKIPFFDVTGTRLALKGTRIQNVPQILVRQSVSGFYEIQNIFP